MRAALLVLSRGCIPANAFLHPKDVDFNAIVRKWHAGGQRIRRPGFSAWQDESEMEAIATEDENACLDDVVNWVNDDDDYECCTIELSDDDAVVLTALCSLYVGLVLFGSGLVIL